MGEQTIIGWTDHTQNFWKGCHWRGEECDNCYAKAAFDRAGWDFDQVTRTKTWSEPDKWQRRLAGTDQYEMVFTCSWSDFFLPEADAWRREAWRIIQRTSNLIYQILTKLPGLMPVRMSADWGTGYPNVWLGTSVGIKKSLWRIPELKRVPAPVHFLSLEPLLEDLCPDLEAHLDDIEWVIVGGESGNGTPNYRPMNSRWARNIRDVCRRRGIPFFFKQSAAVRTEQGTKLDGETIHEYPAWPQGVPLQGMLADLGLFS